jgi:hypothetical protein
MMEAREVLIATLKDVSETDVPPELRAIAFSKVFDLRARGGAPAPPLPRDGGGGGLGSQTPTNPEDKLAAIAAKIGTGRDVAAEVYEVVDDGLELIIPAGKLDNRVAAGAKEIALLVAGGRQAAGIDDWTSIDVIRKVCGDFKKLDQGNFAKSIRQMETEFNRRETDKRPAVKMSRPGWEQYAALVRRLGGES